MILKWPYRVPLDSHDKLSTAHSSGWQFQAFPWCQQTLAWGKQGDCPAARGAFGFLYEGWGGPDGVAAADGAGDSGMIFWK